MVYSTNNIPQYPLYLKTNIPSPPPPPRVLFMGVAIVSLVLKLGSGSEVAGRWSNGEWEEMFGTREGV